MIRHPLLLILFLLITACSPFETSQPPPPPQVVQVAFTPTLRPLVKRLHQCAQEHPEIALTTHETSIIVLTDTGTDVTLWFGEPPQGIFEYAFSLSTDEIKVITGTNVGLQNVTIEQLQDLYTNSNSTYQVWTYGEGHELRDIFEKVVLGDRSTSSYAKLAPNPAAMIEAIAADPMAVGYIPGSWIAKDTQIVSVEPDLHAALAQPILALTHTEPTGKLHTYLVCLQNTAP